MQSTTNDGSLLSWMSRSSNGEAAPQPQQSAADANKGKEVQQLMQELDYTHAHYLKLLERVGGPRWSENVGPVERAPGTGEMQSSMEQRPASPQFLARRASQTSVSSAEVGESTIKRTFSNAVSGRLHTVVGDARLKALELQLDQSRAALREAEERASVARIEADQLRDRGTRREHEQYNVIKKLRESLKETTEKLEEEKLNTQERLASAHRIHEEETKRLMNEAHVLRTQMSELTGSLGGLLEGRSQAIAAAAYRTKAMLGDEKKRASTALTTAQSEHEKELETLRQKSELQYEMKAAEAASLSSQLEALHVASAAQVAALQKECDTVFEYAEKMAEIVRRVETGSYPVIERLGLRVLHIPAREKPLPPDASKLKYLQARVEAANRVLALMPAWSPPLEAAAGTRTKAHASPDRSDGTSSTSVEVMKAQWETELRNSVTASALADLRSDKTVEYIRSLEEKVSNYRSELQAERRKTADSLVALKSVQRVQALGGAVMTHNVSSPLMRTPAWGPGHNEGYDASTLRRPETARSIMVGGGSSLGRSISQPASRASTSAPRTRPRTAVEYARTSAIAV